MSKLLVRLSCNRLARLAVYHSLYLELTQTVISNGCCFVFMSTTLSSIK